MTDEFDDNALRQALSSRAGGPVDAGSARQGVIRRAERTRTLRTGAIVGTTSLAVIAGLLLLPNIGGAPSAPADQPAAPTIDTVAPRQATTLPRAETTTTTPTAPSTTPTPTPTPTTTPTSTTEPASVPVTDPSSTTAPSVAPTTTTAPTVTTAAPDPGDPPFTRQYDSTGGSITVNWNGSALTLLSTAPASGYETEIEDQSADRIRVRFRSDNDDSRIEVRAQDGRVDHTIS